MMVVFGLNKFFGFIAVQPPVDPISQQFLGMMFSSYLFVVIALGEILGGTLLFIPRTRVLGWLMLTPIMFNIIAFHVAHDFIGNGIWLTPSLLFLAEGYLLRKENVKMPNF
ncbi:MAG: hypothetical protein AAGB24_03765 [Bacteroidota bacterium]